MSDLIHRLAELIAQDNAVLFVGAGLRQGPEQSSLVQRIADALAARIEYDRPDRSLPAVARDYEVLKGRNALILALREELENLGGEPAPIHQLIADAVLPQTKVISSRFDQVLEHALDQFEKPYVLIVRDTDLPFFDETKVTLIKIQGDISQPDSLVITEDDIHDFIRKLPTVSDVVKAFFATKTLIFLGYDLNSEHFKRFFREVTHNLSAFQRRAYAIVPEALDDVERRYWEDQNVEICPRDPFSFLEALDQAVDAAMQEPERVEENPLRQLAERPLPPRPYKALDSFTEADVAIFAGRTEESQRLTNRILAHRMTVLYGESGSGKTSLLQAGVTPHLAEQRSLLVTCAPAPDQPLPELLQRSLIEAGESAGLPDPEEEDLVATIRAWQRALNGSVVLAVDQFEQFFLAYGTEERQEAIDFLNELQDDRSLDLRLVFVAREDFLGRLQALDEQLPGLLDVRFRLERLGREEARAAIEEPARLFDVTWEPALVQQLLDDLYQGGEGGVAPPQLQIVCDRLYRDVVEPGNGAAGNADKQITLADFRELGGTTAILGSYLDQVVQSFSAERQPTVRSLLGALVSSGGVKQRLALEDLARAAEVEQQEARSILDELSRQRVVQRYEVTAESEGSRLEYELTHDYLVPRIARWLGDDFWDAQKAREIVRQALPEWEERSRLPAPDDLRLVSAQSGQVRFSDTEAEMLYAAAVCYGERPADWQELLSDEACRRILLRLLEHPEASARRQAARRLAEFRGGDSSTALAQTALDDPDQEVREAAAHAIAGGADSDGEVVDEAAVAHLVEATSQPATADAATQALVTVRDLRPASQELLPDDLRSSVWRRVLRKRWERNRHEILATTLRGLQAGFWSLGLSLGPLLGLLSWSGPRLEARLVLGAVLQGVSIAGLLGAFAVGSGALAGVLLRSLQDEEHSLRTGAVMTVASALFFGVGWVVLGYGSPGTPRPVQSLLGGLVSGLGMAGAATLPMKLSTPLRLALTVLAGMVLFELAGYLDLFGFDSFWWLLLLGGASGIGFFLGLTTRLDLS